MRNRRNLLCLLAFIGALVGCVTIAPYQPITREELSSKLTELPKDCRTTTSTTRRSASQLLERLKEADQKDRQQGIRLTADVIANDRERQEAVANLVQRHCLMSGRDYANAALLYTHSGEAGHTWQAFLWTQEAIKRGAHAESLMVNTLDRFLLLRGCQQVFGSQITLDPASGCYYLDAVDKSDFSDLRRRYFSKEHQRATFELLLDANKDRQCKGPSRAKDLKSCAPFVRSLSFPDN